MHSNRGPAIQYKYIIFQLSHRCAANAEDWLLYEQYLKFLEYIQIFSYKVLLEIIYNVISDQFFKEIFKTLKIIMN